MDLDPPDPGSLFALPAAGQGGAGPGEGGGEQPAPPLHLLVPELSLFRGVVATVVPGPPAPTGAGGASAAADSAAAAAVDLELRVRIRGGRCLPEVDEGRSTHVVVASAGVRGAEASGPAPPLPPRCTCARLCPRRLTGPRGSAGPRRAPDVRRGRCGAGRLRLGRSDGAPLRQTRPPRHLRPCAPAPLRPRPRSLLRVCRAVLPSRDGPAPAPAPPQLRALRRRLGSPQGYAAAGPLHVVRSSWWVAPRPFPLPGPRVAALVKRQCRRRRLARPREACRVEASLASLPPPAARAAGAGAGASLMDAEAAEAAPSSSGGWLSLRAREEEHAIALPSDPSGAIAAAVRTWFLRVAALACAFARHSAVRLG